MTKIYFIIGSASGGTSATAGALAVNGFFCDGAAPYFEGPGIRTAFSFQAEPPPDGVSYREYELSADYVAGLTARATAAGFARAVMKVPNGPVWRAEMIKLLPVFPVLVWRDPADVVASLRRRWGDRVADRPLTARVPEIQARILELHETEGWPLVKFTKENGQAALSKALGVSLPIAHIRPEVETP